MPPSHPGPGPVRTRAVSTVVGVVLMVAIVVLLAAVVASMAMGFEGKLGEPAATGAFEEDYTATGQGNTDDRPYVFITHQVGRTVDAENIVIRDESGNSIQWNDVWTGGPEVKAGEYVHIDGFASDSVLDPICEEGQRYFVIVQNDEGESLMVNEWTVPSDPDVPGEPDGIPSWC